MTSKGYAQADPMMLGVKVAIVREIGGGVRQTLHWEQLVIKTQTPESPATEPEDSMWLRLPDDDARALYEALADHFGHAGHDIRALRKDYEAERARVDKLIDRAVPRQP